MRFTIILWPEPDEGGYSVLVSALPGCATHGKTVQECVERAQEAIAGHVEALIAAGEPVPQEETPPQAITLDLRMPVPAA